MFVIQVLHIFLMLLNTPLCDRSTCLHLCAARSDVGEPIARVTRSSFVIIEEVYHGVDGVIRRARVRVSDNGLSRIIIRLQTCSFGL